MNDLTEDDGQLITKIHLAAVEVAKKRGIDKTGYRFLTNIGAHAGQTVFHIHFHLLGGEGLGRVGSHEARKREFNLD